MRTPSPSPDRSRRTIALAAAMLALLAVAACSRVTPTAPSGASDAHGVRHMSPWNIIDINDQFVVTLAPGASPAAVAHDYGAVLLDFQQGVATLGVGTTDPIDLAIQMKNDTRVVTWEPNDYLEPTEVRQQSVAFDDGHGSASSFAEQSAVRVVRLPRAQRVSKGEGVVVAILDTGIDPSHPAFRGHLVGGYDFVDDDPDPTDVRDYADNDADGFVDEAYGHGTHVAGIVALTAPRARIMMVRVLDSDGRGDVRGVAAGVRWATAHGARVINMSLGMLRSSAAVRLAIDDAEAHGVVCVTAAGNWGSESPQEFPATDRDAAAVAAVDANEYPATFTSYGSFVALCAPGVGVRSAYPGGGYRVWSGTSMAAPFVSGVAALLLARHPDWSLDDVMSRIQETATPLAGFSPLQAGKLGAGVLNAAAALGSDTQTVAGGEPNIIQIGGRP